MWGFDAEHQRVDLIWFANSAPARFPINDPKVTQNIGGLGGGEGWRRLS